jgi:2'-5' RNA ligase
MKMVTEYVADVSHWKRWQQEYRFGVLLILPPDPPRSQVNALRAKYAWSQSSECDAHISLTVPLPQALTQSHWGELESIAGSIKPFPIRYGRLKHYLPHAGVCLEIEPQEKLDRLRIALEMASCFAGAPRRRYPFSAHMTIAEMITVEQTKAIMEELKAVAPSGVFQCTNVSYAVPDADFRFTERARLDLGGQPTH